MFEIKPLGNIALSFSGGGYRAAAFHLGTLSFLNKMDLLKNVTTLSTVSGGTILGACYAVSLVENKSYDTFKTEFENFLKSTNVVEIALKKIYPKNSEFQNRELSLIRAASEVYNDKLFKGKTFDVLLNSDINLEEIAFNATEFNTGKGFRFAKSQSSGTVIGNQDFNLNETLAKDIRLSDIVAASSCFPGGFEPIRFPDDFLLSNKTLTKIKDDKEFKEPLPLMDGGIFDNQGLDAIFLAFKRKNTNIKLIVVSDTTQRQAPLFEYPIGTRKGKVPLAFLIGLLLNLLCPLSFFTSLIIFYYLCTDFTTLIGKNIFKLIFLYFTPLIISSVVCILMIILHFKLSSGLDVKMAGVTFNLQPILDKLTFSDAVSMAKSRFESLVAMSSSVFLNRIRGLLFKALASNEDYKNKHFFNLIYDMNDPTRRKTIYNENPWLRPCDSLKKLAENAEKMATTLWFEDENQLKTLTLCGEITTCHNLLVYFHQKRSEEIKYSPYAIFPVYYEVKELWLRFNTNEFIEKNVSLKWEYVGKKDFHK